MQENYNLDLKVNEIVTFLYIPEVGKLLFEFLNSLNLYNKRKIDKNLSMFKNLGV